MWLRLSLFGTNEQSTERLFPQIGDSQKITEGRDKRTMTMKTQSERQAHLDMLTRNLAAMEEEVKSARREMFGCSSEPSQLVDKINQKVFEESVPKVKNSILLNAAESSKRPASISPGSASPTSTTDNEKIASKSASCNDEEGDDLPNLVAGESGSSADEGSDSGKNGSLSSLKRPREDSDLSVTSLSEAKISKSEGMEAKIDDKVKSTAVPAPAEANIDSTDKTDEKSSGKELKADIPPTTSPAAVTTKGTRAGRSGDRAGKWTTEEEEYARYLIECFDKGVLRGPEKGTSLRSYLAKALNCDPMRISKKYVGIMRIGKRFYRKCLSFDAEARTEIASRNLEILRRRWEMREQYRAEDRNSGFGNIYRDLGELSPAALSLAPRFGNLVEGVAPCPQSQGIPLYPQPPSHWGGLNVAPRPPMSRKESQTRSLQPNPDQFAGFFNGMPSGSGGVRRPNTMVPHPSMRAGPQPPMPAPTSKQSSASAESHMRFMQHMGQQQIQMGNQHQMPRPGGGDNQSDYMQMNAFNQLGQSRGGGSFNPMNMQGGGQHFASHGYNGGNNAPMPPNGSNVNFNGGSYNPYSQPMNDGQRMNSLIFAGGANTQKNQIAEQFANFMASGGMQKMPPHHMSSNGSSHYTSNGFPSNQNIPMNSYQQVMGGGANYHFGPSSSSSSSSTSSSMPHSSKTETPSAATQSPLPQSSKYSSDMSGLTPLAMAAAVVQAAQQQSEMRDRQLQEEKERAMKRTKVSK